MGPASSSLCIERAKAHWVSSPPSPPVLCWPSKFMPNACVFPLLRFSYYLGFTVLQKSPSRSCI